MENKFTKGKWVVVKANMKDTNKDELAISLDGGEKSEKGYRLIACISPINKADKFDFANALLISKAPEMLEMLKYFVENNMLSIVGEEKAKQLIKEATDI
jgi:hypothetical protein